MCASVFALPLQRLSVCWLQVFAARWLNIDEPAIGAAATRSSITEATVSAKGSFAVAFGGHCRGVRFCVWERGAGRSGEDTACGRQVGG